MASPAQTLGGALYCELLNLLSNRGQYYTSDWAVKLTFARLMIRRKWQQRMVSYMDFWNEDAVDRFLLVSRIFEDMIGLHSCIVVLKRYYCCSWVKK